MRTTIDLPEKLHARARSIASDTGRTLSETIADLILRGLEDRAGPIDVARSPSTGLSVVSLGGVITSDDVRELEDDDA